MKMHWACLTAAGICLLGACNNRADAGRLRGSGRAISEKRVVQGVKGVVFKHPGSLSLQWGDRESLAIAAEDNLLGHILTEVKDGVLYITSKPGVEIKPTLPILLRLTARPLNRIEASGSGDIKAAPFTVAKCAIQANGSGDVLLEGLRVHSLEVGMNGSGDIAFSKLEAARLEARIHGSGDLSVKDGKAKRQFITLTSSGDYNAPDARGLTAEVQLGGAGNATMWIEETLNATLNGAGDLKYRGKPKVNAKVSGSGRVKAL